MPTSWVAFDGARVTCFAKPEEHDAATVLQGYLKKRPASQAKSMIERDGELKKQAKHAGKPQWQKTIDEARDINKHESYMDKLKATVGEEARKTEAKRKNRERKQKEYDEGRTPKPRVNESIYGPFEPSGVKPRPLNERYNDPFEPGKSSI